MKVQRIGFIIVLLLHAGLCCSTAGYRVPEQYPALSSESSVLFVGDMMFEWAVNDTMSKKGADYPLQNIQSFLHSFDFVMANLETPLTNKGFGDSSLDKKYIFKTTMDTAHLLNKAGIQAVTIANNHMLDYGIGGLTDTLVALSSYGIVYAGAGINETTASQPIFYKLGAMQMVIICYTQICSRDMVARGNPGVNFFELSKAIQDIQKYNFADFIVINLHWGNEYFYYPSSKQIEIAHALIDAGADVIAGHHPHVYQGIEIYKNKPIIYSLGNFLFGSKHEGINDTIACALYIAPEGKIAKIRVYAIKGKFDDQIIQPGVLNADDATHLLHHFLQISKSLDGNFVDRASINNNYIEYSFR
ncbi:MAG TPA: CapA family protein [Spirochaetota bacterium]|nr:CapA family protein [Spirochaetota bacterium]